MIRTYLSSLYYKEDFESNTPTSSNLISNGSINTKEDFIAFLNNPNISTGRIYTLTNNIDLGYSTLPTIDTLINTRFNGNGFTISNININNNGYLINTIEENCIIENVKFTGYMRPLFKNNFGTIRFCEMYGIDYSIATIPESSYTSDDSRYLTSLVFSNGSSTRMVGTISNCIFRNLNLKYYYVYNVACAAIYNYNIIEKCVFSNITVGLTQSDVNRTSQTNYNSATIAIHNYYLINKCNVINNFAIYHGNSALFCRYNYQNGILSNLNFTPSNFYTDDIIYFGNCTAFGINQSASSLVRCINVNTDFVFRGTIFIVPIIGSYQNVYLNNTYITYSLFTNSDKVYCDFFDGNIALPPQITLPPDDGSVKIRTVADFAFAVTYFDDRKVFNILADINLSTLNISRGYPLIGCKINGNGYTLSNINKTFISIIDENSILYNIKFENVTSRIFDTLNGKIYNCSFNNVNINSNPAYIIGNVSTNAEISYCIFKNITMTTGTIDTPDIDSRSGVIALENYGTIRNCYMYNITFNNALAGGMVYNHYGTIKNCLVDTINFNTGRPLDGAGGICYNFYTALLSNCIIRNITNGYLIYNMTYDNPSIKCIKTNMKFLGIGPRVISNENVYIEDGSNLTLASSSTFNGSYDCDFTEPSSTFRIVNNSTIPTLPATTTRVWVRPTAPPPTTAPPRQPKSIINVESNAQFTDIVNGNFADEGYKLDSDINMANMIINATQSVIYVSLDGNGHRIANIDTSLGSTLLTRVKFIQVLAAESVIKNITFLNCKFMYSMFVTNKGRIENCVFKNCIFSDTAGLTYLNDTTGVITNCTFIDCSILPDNGAFNGGVVTFIAQTNKGTISELRFKNLTMESHYTDSSTIVANRTINKTCVLSIQNYGTISRVYIDALCNVRNYIVGDTISGGPGIRYAHIPATPGVPSHSCYGGVVYENIGSVSYVKINIRTDTSSLWRKFFNICQISINQRMKCIQFANNINNNSLFEVPSSLVLNIDMVNPDMTLSTSTVIQSFLPNTDIINICDPTKYVFEEIQTETPTTLGKDSQNNWLIQSVDDFLYILSLPTLTGNYIITTNLNFTGTTIISAKPNLVGCNIYAKSPVELSNLQINDYLFNTIDENSSIVRIKFINFTYTLANVNNGRIEYCMFYNSNTSINIRSVLQTGGAISNYNGTAENPNGTIRYCYIKNIRFTALGTAIVLSASLSGGDSYAGSACGMNYGIITKCLFENTTVNNNNRYSGTVCGFNNNTVTQCYLKNIKLTSTNNLMGYVIGFIYGGIINNIIIDTINMEYIYNIIGTRISTITLSEPISCIKFINISNIAVTIVNSLNTYSYISNLNVNNQLYNINSSITCNYFSGILSYYNISIPNTQLPTVGYPICKSSIINGTTTNTFIFTQVPEDEDKVQMINNRYVLSTNSYLRYIVDNTPIIGNKYIVTLDVTTNVTLTGVVSTTGILYPPRVQLSIISKKIINATSSQYTTLSTVECGGSAVISTVYEIPSGFDTNNKIGFIITTDNDNFDILHLINSVTFDYFYNCATTTAIPTTTIVPTTTVIPTTIIPTTTINYIVSPNNLFVNGNFELPVFYNNDTIRASELDPYYFDFVGDAQPYNYIGLAKISSLPSNIVRTGATGNQVLWTTGTIKKNVTLKPNTKYRFSTFCLTNTLNTTPRYNKIITKAQNVTTSALTAGINTVTNVNITTFGLNNLDFTTDNHTNYDIKLTGNGGLDGAGNPIYLYFDNFGLYEYVDSTLPLVTVTNRAPPTTQAPTTFRYEVTGSNLITNGDFEIPSLTTMGVNSTILTTTTLLRGNDDNRAGIIKISALPQTVNITTATVNQVLWLDSFNSSIYQDINLKRNTRYRFAGNCLNDSAYTAPNYSIYVADVNASFNYSKSVTTYGLVTDEITTNNQIRYTIGILNKTTSNKLYFDNFSLFEIVNTSLPTTTTRIITPGMNILLNGTFESPSLGTSSTLSFDLLDKSSFVWESNINAGLTKIQSLPSTISIVSGTSASGQVLYLNTVDASIRQYVTLKSNTSYKLSINCLADSTRAAPNYIINISDNMYFNVKTTTVTTYGNQIIDFNTLAIKSYMITITNKGSILYFDNVNLYEYIPPTTTARPTTTVKPTTTIAPAQLTTSANITTARPTTISTVTFPSIIGRYIRLNRSDTGTDKYLNIAGIDVYDEYNNIITLTEAAITVNPPYNTIIYPNINLIDRNPNTLAHTSDATGAYMELDLGNDRKISKIIVTNRQDCCKDRIVGARLDIKNNNQNIIYSYNFTDSNQNSFEINMASTTRAIQTTIGLTTIASTSQAPTIKQTTTPALTSKVSTTQVLPIPICSSTNKLLNGDFMAPLISASVLRILSINNWTTTGIAGVIKPTTNTLIDNSQAAFIQNSGSISQKVGIVYPATYELSVNAKKLDTNNFSFTLELLANTTSIINKTVTNEGISNLKYTIPNNSPLIGNDLYVKITLTSGYVAFDNASLTSDEGCVKPTTTTIKPTVPVLPRDYTPVVTISNSRQFIDLLNNTTITGFYELIDNIDLEGASIYHNLNTLSKAVIFGNGFTIANIRTGQYLFNTIEEDSFIDNIRFVNCNYTIVLNNKGTISNCEFIDCTLENSAVSMVCLINGSDQNNITGIGYIYNCVFNNIIININKLSYAATVAIYNTGYISNCNLINISITNTSNNTDGSWIGGIVGINYFSIDKCNISYSYFNADYIGAIVATTNSKSSTDHSSISNIHINSIITTKDNTFIGPIIPVGIINTDDFNTISCIYIDRQFYIDYINIPSLIDSYNASYTIINDTDGYIINNNNCTFYDNSNNIISQQPFTPRDISNIPTAQVQQQLITSTIDSSNSLSFNVSNIIQESTDQIAQNIVDFLQKYSELNVKEVRREGSRIYIRFSIEQFEQFEQFQSTTTAQNVCSGNICIICDGPIVECQAALLKIQDTIVSGGSRYLSTTAAIKTPQITTKAISVPYLTAAIVADNIVKINVDKSTDAEIKKIILDINNKLNIKKDLIFNQKTVGNEIQITVTNSSEKFEINEHYSDSVKNIVYIFNTNNNIINITTLLNINIKLIITPNKKSYLIFIIIFIIIILTAFAIFYFKINPLHLISNTVSTAAPISAPV